jgi:Protein of unknown function (DUF3551)
MSNITKRRRSARWFVLGAGIMVAIWGCGGTRARADGPWCASVQGPDGGAVSCSYGTWQQCMAALGGVGGICHLNPVSGAPSGWRDRLPSRILGSPKAPVRTVLRP